MPRPYIRRPKRKTLRKGEFTDLDFIKSTRSVIGSAQQFIIKVGTAILGGDLTGNARGLNAIDIQTERQEGSAGETDVASGDYAVQIGAFNEVSAAFGVRIGYAGRVSGENAVGIGSNASADGESAVAIGLNSNAEGDDSTALGGADIRTEGALGIGSTARLLNAPYVFNTGVGPIIKRGAGLVAEANWPKHLGGALACYMSGIINLKTATFYTLALPDNCRIFLFAMGIETVTVSALTVQPTIKFGVTFTDDKYVAARQTTQLTAALKREHYLPESLADFETDPNFTVTVGATATTMNARVYWVGLLVEDE